MHTSLFAVCEKLILRYKLLYENCITAHHKIWHGSSSNPPVTG
jgi:hypothetical protein